MSAARGRRLRASTRKRARSAPGRPRRNRGVKRRVAIGEALQNLVDQVMVLPGVAGVAEGRHRTQRYLKVYVVKKTPARLSRIPATVKGYPVTVEETGSLRALDRKASSARA